MKLGGVPLTQLSFVWRGHVGEGILDSTLRHHAPGIIPGQAFWEGDLERLKCTERGKMEQTKTGS